MNRHDDTSVLGDWNDVLEEREKIGTILLIAKLRKPFDLGADAIAVVTALAARNPAMMFFYSAACASGDIASKRSVARATTSVL